MKIIFRSIPVTFLPIKRTQDRKWAVQKYKSKERYKGDHMTAYVVQEKNRRRSNEIIVKRDGRNASTRLENKRIRGAPVNLEQLFNSPWFNSYLQLRDANNNNNNNNIIN